MNQKAIIICSSPNLKGKTASISELTAEHLKKNQVHSEVKHIANLNYKANGCIACFKCQETEHYECIIKDEATPILESLNEYNYIIFATPIYFFGPNAQLKLFLDRVYSLYNFKGKDQPFETVLKNKTIGLIATAGGDLDAGLRLTDDTFKAICDFTEIPFESLLVEYTDKYGDHIKDSPEIQERVKDFTERILETQIAKSF